MEKKKVRLSSSQYALITDLRKRSFVEMSDYNKQTILSLRRHGIIKVIAGQVAFKSKWRNA